VKKKGCILHFDSTLLEQFWCFRCFSTPLLDAEPPEVLACFSKAVQGWQEVGTGRVGGSNDVKSLTGNHHLDSKLPGIPTNSPTPATLPHLLCGMVNPTTA
jgi:hypothetical protein